MRPSRRKLQPMCSDGDAIHRLTLYDMESGKLLTNMFVHVERRTNLREGVKYSCSCRVYKLAYAYRAQEMHNNLTCSHCLYCINVIQP